ncbi:MAG: alpha-L-fucosidase [Clostridia bacterium]
MWYENDYRRIFMDMHLNDSNDEYLSKLNLDSFVASLVDADVSSVVVKAKSHAGLHYWPSEYGRMHSTLEKRNLDYVGEMSKKCHEHGINVILYFSQTYDNYAYEKHITWRQRTQVGTPSKLDFGAQKGRYGIVCPNNKHYQKYCHEILTELATKYEFESIFMDMPFWSRICYCPSCQAKYLREQHRFLPLIWRYSSPKWHKFQSARERWIDEFMAGNTKAIKDVKPEISIEHNMAAVGLNWYYANNETQFRNSDYASGDYYGGYLEQTFMCKFYNNMTLNKPFSYITSRCDNSLYNHTVTRTYHDLLIHDMNALVHGGAFSICDAMNPDGTISDKVYHNEIKQLFATTKPVEKFVSGDILCDVAIWYNTEYKVNKNFVQSPFNIAQIMLDYNIAFDVIGSKNLATTKAQVISINDIQAITDDEVATLDSYVRNGGNLFVTGALGNSKKFEELVGVQLNGSSPYLYTYLRPNGQSDIFEDFDDSSPFPVNNTALEATVVADGVTVLATSTYPYTLPSTHDFAAIHTNPPGINTDLPAVIKRKLGKGNIIWCASPIELMTAHNCKKTIARLIMSLLDKREFESNAPSFVEALKWTKNGKTYLSLVNQQVTTPIYPIDNIELTLDKKYANVSIVAQDSATTDGEKTATANGEKVAKTEKTATIEKTATAKNDSDKTLQANLVISEKDGKTVIKVLSLNAFAVIECC